METDKLILRFIQKNSRRSNNLFNKVRGPVPQNKTYYKAILIKTMPHCTKTNKSMIQNREPTNILMHMWAFVPRQK